MSDDRVSLFVVDGRSYELHYDFNDIVDAEEKLSCNLLDAIERLLGNGTTTAQQLRGLLFAMITPCIGFPESPADQLKFCGRLIRIDTMSPLISALGHACALAVSQEYGDSFKKSMERAQEAAEQERAVEMMHDVQKQTEPDPEHEALKAAGAATL